MKRSLWSMLLAFAVLAAGGATPGCSCNHNGGHGGDGGAAGGGAGGGGSGGGGMTNACGDQDPSCMTPCLGPTCMPPNMFPLPSDNPPDPNVGADGVGRNGMGYIVLNQGMAASNFLWIADDVNYGIGMVSKIDTKKSTASGGGINHDYREVARYLTVTCESRGNEATSYRDHSTYSTQLGTIQTSTCDKTNGCCSRDVAGSRGTIQFIHNHPSRTAVDFNGDAWVANRAHIETPNQSSVTKIANKNNSITDTDCIDRNANGKIESSFDANGDGIINTDCNDNGIPDSIADVAATPCKANTPQEFWGLDDECVLFTTNTGPVNGWGRPLALGPGAIDFGPSDAWAGRFQDGIFYRIDGNSGLIKSTAQLKLAQGQGNCTASGGCQAQPYGAAIDQTGILWAPDVYAHNLWYLDTANTTNVNFVAAPNPSNAPNGFYGIAIDGYKAVVTPGQPAILVQQIWLGELGKPSMWRYTPLRGQGFAALATGNFTEFTFPNNTGGGATGGNGRGVGVDNRKPTSFAWLALDGNVDNAGHGGLGKVAVDNSFVVPNGTVTTQVVTIPATAMFSTVTGTTTLGAGVADNLDLWGINQGTSTATHFTVDAAGNVTAPTAADQVRLDDNGMTPAATKTHTAPNPYTYSDFTGFGLRNFTNPHGSYSYIYTGCGPKHTKWIKVIWDADTPPGTAIAMKARAADDKNLISQAGFTGSYTTSPADLKMAPGPLQPNPSGFLQVEFDLTTTNNNTTPALKSFTVVYECTNGIG